MRRDFSDSLLVVIVLFLVIDQRAPVFIRFDYLDIGMEVSPRGRALKGMAHPTEQRLREVLAHKLDAKGQAVAI